MLEGSFHVFLQLLLDGERGTPFLSFLRVSGFPCVGVGFCKYNYGRQTRIVLDQQSQTRF